MCICCETNFYYLFPLFIFQNKNTNGFTWYVGLIGLLQTNCKFLSTKAVPSNEDPTKCSPQRKLKEAFKERKKKTD